MSKYEWDRTIQSASRAVNTMNATKPAATFFAVESHYCLDAPQLLPLGGSRSVHAVATSGQKIGTRFCWREGA